MSYVIKNSRNDIVTTIQPATTSGSTFPIELVGRGISQYGQIIGTTQYKLLENFASNTIPTNAVEGMNWYNSSNKSMNYYDGDQFVQLASSRNSTSTKLELLPSSSNIDFSVVADTPISNGVAGTRFLPTGIVIVPKSGVTATKPALVNVYVENAEDVMENMPILINSDKKAVYLDITGTSRMLLENEVLKLSITNGADGVLKCDVFVYGSVV